MPRCLHFAAAAAEVNGDAVDDELRDVICKGFNASPCRRRT